LTTVLNAEQLTPFQKQFLMACQTSELTRIDNRIICRAVNSLSETVFLIACQTSELTRIDNRIICRAVNSLSKNSFKIA
jgi:hypothetical protein